MTDFTLREIHSQPEVWQKVIERSETENHPAIAEWINSDQPVLTGSGSSFYLSLVVASCYTQFMHRKALAVSASEVCTFPNTLFSDKGNYSLLAFSRKGKSAETVDAARWFQQAYSSKPAAISTVLKSPLFDICNPGLLLTEAAEQSRYMTRSFTGPLLAMQYLIASCTCNKDLKKELRRLPELGTKMLQRCESTVKFLAEQKQFDDYVCLGHGPFYGLASEAMLKVKEMVRAAAVAYPSLEVMHGPNYFLRRQTLVTLLHAESVENYELPLLKRLHETGACTFVICEKATPAISETAEFVFELSSRISEFARLVLVMLVMQLYAYHRARTTGNELE